MEYFILYPFILGATTVIHIELRMLPELIALEETAMLGGRDVSSSFFSFNSQCPLLLSFSILAALSRLLPLLLPFPSFFAFDPRNGPPAPNQLDFPLSELSSFSPAFRLFPINPANGRDDLLLLFPRFRPSCDRHLKQMENHLNS